MIKITKIIAISIVLLVLGCTPEEKAPISPKVEEGLGVIQFQGILKELTGQNKIQIDGIDATIPQCNDNYNPAYVRIALRNNNAETNVEEYVWVGDNDEDEDYFIDIPVVPVSNDGDGDGSQNFLTMESSELQLKAGKYTLEYFAVLNSEGEIIMMAPRKDQDYGPAEFQNFVERALPIPLTIKEGTKHYLKIETLCYDEAFAYAYGYLFFDFEKVNLTHLCLFGNVCNEDQKHRPAHYRLKVWEYNNQTESKGRELINRINEVDFSSQNSNDHSAEVLCVPLPDREGTDYYYGEIYLLENGGSEALIRYGVFTDSGIKLLYDETEDLYTPYHFRESCCGLLDEPELLEYVTEPTEDCEPVQDQDCGECDGKVTSLTLKYLGEDSANVEIKQKAPGNKKLDVFSETVNSGEEFRIDGVYKQNKNKPPSLWTEIYIYVNGQEHVQIHTSCSQDIYTGMIFGDFEIIAGESMNGGPLCPVPE